MLDLEPIKARAEGITPGTWFIEGHNVMNETRSHTMVLLPDLELDEPHDRANAEFIAHAPDDMRALIAELELTRYALDVIEVLNRCKHERATFDRMLDHDRQVYTCDDCGWKHFTMVDPVTGDMLNVSVS